MSRNLSAKHYPENKKKISRKLLKDQNLSKEEKEKSDNMVVSVVETSQKMKNKSLLRIEKNIIE